MHVTVQAKTAKGLRRFLVSGKSGAEAAALLQALVERRERVFDELGEEFEAFQIDASSIEVQPGVSERRVGASHFATDGQRVK